MLSFMVARRPAVCRMFTNVLEGMERRDPSSRDWEVGEKVFEVLDYPCMLVLKAQDKGHWLLPHAVHNLCRLFVAGRDRRQQLDEAPPSAKATAPLEPGRLRIERQIWKTLLGHLQPFVTPVLQYCATRAHVAMALLCDHRHRRVDIFFWIVTLDCPRLRG
mmetsp:Transcript_30298/g.85613  ORF Transcript_30298/g.85613 Transcript_30298/m.85613 type:complete len:161 (+) Transcript_30298:2101-2583(+)